MSEAFTLDVMVDLETISTDNDAGIISIGAVPFNHAFPFPQFYEKIEFVTLEQKGFHLSKSTLDWWSKQSEEARSEAFSGTVPIEEVLSAFASYIKELEVPVNIWGNGSDFDNIILWNAYDRCGIPAPWSFRNNRCFRTLKNVFSFIPAPIFIGEKHNALADAGFQAHHATIIFTALEKMRERNT